MQTLTDVSREITRTRNRYDEITFNYIAFVFHLPNFFSFWLFAIKLDFLSLSDRRLL